MDGQRGHRRLSWCPYLPIYGVHAALQQWQQKTQQERWASCQTTGSPGFVLRVQSVSGTFDQALPGLWQLRHEVFYGVLLLKAVGGCSGCQVTASLLCSQKNILENLYPVSRVSQQAEWCSIRMAPINTGSLTNKSFIVNDFCSSDFLDFLLLMETWIKPCENSTFSELLPPGCSFFSGYLVEVAALLLYSGQL